MSAVIEAPGPRPALECPACLKHFDEKRPPLVLPCGHSQCKKCVGRGSCSDCGHQFEPEGVFPTNLALLEMAQSRKHNQNSRSGQSQHVCGNCDTPLSLENLWLCEKCNWTVLCAGCVLKGHRTHEVVEGAVVERRWDAEVGAVLQQLGQVSLEAESASQLLEEKLKGQRTSAVSQVNEIWEGLVNLQSENMQELQKLKERMKSVKGDTISPKDMMEPPKQLVRDLGGKLQKIKQDQDKIETTAQFVSARLGVCKQAVDELSFLIGQQMSSGINDAVRHTPRLSLDSRIEGHRKLLPMPSAEVRTEKGTTLERPPLPPKKRHTLSPSPATTAVLLDTF